MWPRLKDRARAMVERFPRTAALLGSLWQKMRDEPLVGIALSILLHVVLIAFIVFYGGPGSTYATKRGEPLFVELPDVKDEAPRGNPAAREPGPPAAPLPEPPRPPAVQAPPPAPKAPPPAPKAAPPAPAPPPRVASAPPPEPPREKAAPPAEKAPPRPPDPPAPEAKGPPPAPAPEARPAPPAPAPPAPGPLAPAAPVQEARPAPAAPPAAGPTSPGPSEPARPASPGSQVAMVPPPTQKAPPSYDLKSLGRGGGAGGRGDGRGGVEGEPVPLDSPDPKFSDYLERIRRMIKDKWGFPCADGDPHRYNCSRREGELIIEFGIAKDGQVPFINLRQSTGSENMDAFAMNAIRLAGPFPPVPDAISKKGFPILARFRYVLVDRTMTNILR